MASAESPERLPVGWTEQVASKDGEELKFYHNVITGHKFYTKADVLHFVQLGTPSKGTRQQTRAQSEGNPENKLMLMPAETNDTPCWLPQGWIMESNVKSDGKKYKVYTDPSTGRKFRSKPQIFRYLNSDESDDPMSEQTSMGIESDINMPSEANNTSDWLPQGWIMELKVTGGGRRYKVYIEPSTGHKFYSKPDIYKYLSSDKGNDLTPKQTSDTNLHLGESSGAESPLMPEESRTVKQTRSTSSQKKRSSSSSHPRKVQIVTCEAEGLPPGWIKELKIERTGCKIRKDPYFTDPDTNYVFRSLPDVKRYLKTKDIRNCAIKPRKRVELKFLADDTFASIPEENQSLDNTTIEGTEKEENHAPTIKGTEKEENHAPTIEGTEKQEIYAPPTIEGTEKEENHAPTIEGTEKEEIYAPTIEGTEKEENHAPTIDQLPKTPVSKRKRGRPVAAAKSTDSLIKQLYNSDIIVDSTKPEGEKVHISPCRSSTRIAGPKPGSVQVITPEVEASNNSEQKTLQGSGVGSSLDPCLEFAFKTLRGDIPVEANNLAAQGYNHEQRASSVNAGLPSFSDYARR